MFAPVAGLAVLVVSDTTEVADDDGSDTSLNTLGNDVFRESVQEVASAFRALPIEPKPLVRPAIVTLRLLPSEVVFILFQRVAGKEDQFTAERKRGDVRDAEVDPGSLVARRFGIDHFPTDEM